MGHNNKEDRLVPTQVVHEALGMVTMVLVAAGCLHTIVVTVDAFSAWQRC